MPLPSSETRLAPSTRDANGVGPVLECASAGIEPGDPGLRIRAQRLYAVSREDLFATWTRRTGWESWLRLRARSRATLAPYPGGAFRLEVAEGPAIHVITGLVVDLRPAELLSLSWGHQHVTDHASAVDVMFRQHQQMTEMTELTLIHRRIASRREAAWLMRLWTTVLGKLGEHLADTPRVAGAVRPVTRRAAARGNGGRHAGSEVRATFARSA